MKIAIASGKGGTGKTFVSTNLFWAAQAVGRKITLVDCDAEEPNVGEFLKGKLLSEDPVLQNLPVINAEACAFCGKCVEYCTYNAIFYLPQKKMIQLTEELCHACGACVFACDNGAITEMVKQIGVINKYAFNENAFVIESRTEIGTPSSVPVIHQGINKVDDGAFALLDSPPGISCPFIATVEHADFVLLVTEPTPFGLNDLKLSVETCKELKKPCGVVINRAGLGDREIYDWLKKENIPLLLEIPFDKAIAKLYAEGYIISEYNEVYKNMFLSLLNKIEAFEK